MPIYITLSENINAAMYAKSDIELSILIAQWEDFKKTVRRDQNVKQPVSNEYDAKINPT
jgi:hypothetical protein